MEILFFKGKIYFDVLVWGNRMYVIEQYLYIFYNMYLSLGSWDMNGMIVKYIISV